MKKVDIRYRVISLMLVLMMIISSSNISIVYGLGGTSSGGATSAGGSFNSNTTIKTYGMGVYLVPTLNEDRFSMGNPVSSSEKKSIKSDFNKVFGAKIGNLYHYKVMTKKGANTAKKVVQTKLSKQILSNDSQVWKAIKAKKNKSVLVVPQKAFVTKGKIKIFNNGLNNRVIKDGTHGITYLDLSKKCYNAAGFGDADKLAKSLVNSTGGDITNAKGYVKKQTKYLDVADDSTRSIWQKFISDFCNNIFGDGNLTKASKKIYFKSGSNKVDYATYWVNLMKDLFNISGTSHNKMLQYVDVVAIPVTLCGKLGGAKVEKVATSWCTAVAAGLGSYSVSNTTNVYGSQFRAKYYNNKAPLNKANFGMTSSTRSPQAVCAGGGLYNTSFLCSKDDNSYYKRKVWNGDSANSKNAYSKYSGYLIFTNLATAEKDEFTDAMFTGTVVLKHANADGSTSDAKTDKLLLVSARQSLDDGTDADNVVETEDVKIAGKTLRNVKTKIPAIDRNTNVLVSSNINAQTYQIYYVKNTDDEITYTSLDNGDGVWKLNGKADNMSSFGSGYLRYLLNTKSKANTAAGNQSIKVYDYSRFRQATYIKMKKNLSGRIENMMSDGERNSTGGVADPSSKSSDAFNADSVKTIVPQNKANVTLTNLADVSVDSYVYKYDIKLSELIDNLQTYKNKKSGDNFGSFRNYSVNGDILSGHGIGEVVVYQPKNNGVNYNEISNKMAQNNYRIESVKNSMTLSMLVGNASDYSYKRSLNQLTDINNAGEYLRGEYLSKDLNYRTMMFGLSLYGKDKDSTDLQGRTITNSGEVESDTLVNIGIVNASVDSGKALQQIRQPDGSDRYIPNIVGGRKDETGIVTNSYQRVVGIKDSDIDDDALVMYGSDYRTAMEKKGTYDTYDLDNDAPTDYDADDFDADESNDLSGGISGKFVVGSEYIYKIEDVDANIVGDSTNSVFLQGYRIKKDGSGGWSTKLYTLYLGNNSDTNKKYTVDCGTLSKDITIGSGESAVTYKNAWAYCNEIKIIKTTTGGSQLHVATYDKYVPKKAWWYNATVAEDGKYHGVDNTQEAWGWFNCTIDYQLSIPDNGGIKEGTLYFKDDDTDTEDDAKDSSDDAEFVITTNDSEDTETTTSLDDYEDETETSSQLEAATFGIATYNMYDQTYIDSQMQKPLVVTLNNESDTNAVISDLSTGSNNPEFKFSYSQSNYEVYPLSDVATLNCNNKANASKYNVIYVYVPKMSVYGHKNGDTKLRNQVKTILNNNKSKKKVSQFVDALNHAGSDINVFESSFEKGFEIGGVKYNNKYQGYTIVPVLFRNDDDNDERAYVLKQFQLNHVFYSLYDGVAKTEGSNNYNIKYGRNVYAKTFVQNVKLQLQNNENKEGFEKLASVPYITVKDVSSTTDTFISKLNSNKYETYKYLVQTINKNYNGNIGMSTDYDTAKTSGVSLNILGATILDYGLNLVRCKFNKYNLNEAISALSYKGSDSTTASGRTVKYVDYAKNFIGTQFRDYLNKGITSENKLKEAVQSSVTNTSYNSPTDNTATSLFTHNIIFKAVDDSTELNLPEYTTVTSRYGSGEQCNGNADLFKATILANTAYRYLVDSENATLVSSLFMFSKANETYSKQGYLRMSAYAEQYIPKTSSLALREDKDDTGVMGDVERINDKDEKLTSAIMNPNSYNTKKTHLDIIGRATYFKGDDDEGTASDDGIRKKYVMAVTVQNNNVMMKYLPEVRMTIDLLNSSGGVVNCSNGSAERNTQIIKVLAHTYRRSMSSSMYVVNVKNNMKLEDSKIYSTGMASGARADALSKNRTDKWKNAPVIYAGSDFTVSSKGGEIQIDLTGYSVDLIDKDADSDLTYYEGNMSSDSYWRGTVKSRKLSYTLRTMSYSDWIKSDSDLHKEWGKDICQTIKLPNGVKDNGDTGDGQNVKDEVINNNVERLKKDFDGWVEQMTNRDAYELTADMTIDGEGGHQTYKNLNFNYSKNNEVEASHENSYPLVVRNGQLVTGKNFPNNNGKGALGKGVIGDTDEDDARGYIAMIMQMACDADITYDEAEEMFESSNLYKTVLKAIESNTDSYNVSKNSKNQDGNNESGLNNSHWYDEEVKTIVVRRYVADTFKLGGDLVCEDKIDVQASNLATKGKSANENQDRGKDTKWKGAKGEIQLELKFTDKAPFIYNYPDKTIRTILNKQALEGARFIVPNQTTDSFTVY